MKKLYVSTLLFTLLLVCSCKLLATNYYVSNVGNDAATGKSSSKTWATLYKVAKFPFLPGDTVFFKRGDVFRGTIAFSGSGSIDRPIVFDAYGTGPLPLILGSKNLSTTNEWTFRSPNIYKTTNTIGINRRVIDVSQMVFNKEKGFGVKRNSFTELVNQGDFFLSPFTDTLYCFSKKNPGSMYTSIEVGGVYSEDVIAVRSSRFISIRNLDVRYSGNNGIIIRNCSNILVENCKVSWCGGWWYSYKTPRVGPGRMGNGIQMWLADSNITIRNNSIDQIYDAGISPQGTGEYTQINIFMYGNVISNCYYSYEIFLKAPATINNINFDNNTCINSGSQWSQHQRPDSLFAEHIRHSSNTGNISGCSIRNNIFNGSLIRHCQINSTTGFVIDYNLIYNAPAFSFNGKVHATFSQWKKVSSYDTHSIYSDPLFVSADDYRLQVGSPAIGSGTDVGFGAKVNMGAYAGKGVTVSYKKRK